MHASDDGTIAALPSDCISFLYCLYYHAVYVASVYEALYRQCTRFNLEPAGDSAVSWVACDGVRAYANWVPVRIDNTGQYIRGSWFGVFSI